MISQPETKNTLKALVYLLASYYGMTYTCRSSETSHYRNRVYVVKQTNIWDSHFVNIPEQVCFFWE